MLLAFPWWSSNGSAVFGWDFWEQLYLKPGVYSIEPFYFFFIGRDLDNLANDGFIVTPKRERDG